MQSAIEPERFAPTVAINARALKTVGRNVLRNGVALLLITGGLIPHATAEAAYTDTYDLTVQRLLDAPPADIFDWYTDPEADKTLFAGEPNWIVEVNSDIRVGGQWDLTTGPPATPAFHESNLFTQVDRPNYLSFRSTLTTPDGSSIDRDVEVTFRGDENGRTLMTIVQRGFPNAELRDLVGGGVSGVFDRLQRMAQDSPMQ
jgi:uncharacterized protein YndB with AHSA1/START domain